MTSTVVPAIHTTARALLLGDRIDAAGLERADTICVNPLAFHAGASGFSMGRAPGGEPSIPGIADAPPASDKALLLEWPRPAGEPP